MSEHGRVLITALKFQGGLHALIASAPPVRSARTSNFRAPPCHQPTYLSA